MGAAWQPLFAKNTSVSVEMVVPLQPLEAKDCNPKSDSKTKPLKINRFLVKYKTVGVDKVPAVASGIIAYKEGFQGGPMLSYQHGTVVNKSQAPSRGYKDTQAFICAFTKLNMVVVAADYIGLGDSHGYHPYLHKETSASSTMDFIAAADKVLAEQKKSWNKKLFLAGYSQGGFVTMALLQSLEQSSKKHGYQVMASMPMAGPYDLSGVTLQAILDAPPATFTVLVALYVMHSYQKIYRNIWGDTDRVLQKPYREVFTIFDKQDYQTLIETLPDRLDKVLTKTFMDEVRKNKNHPLVANLRQNDIHHWRPSSPMKLCYASADTLVTPKNATNYFEKHKKSSKTLSIVDVGAVEHGPGFSLCLVESVKYFASFLSKAKSKK
jgi:alpha/beta superfamily hydrolase